MRVSTLLFTIVSCLAFLSCSSRPTRNEEGSHSTKNGENFHTAKNGEEVNSILWEITGKNLEGKSFLLATHHIVDYHFLDSIPQYQSILDSVDAVAVEHDGAAFGKSALQAFFEAKTNKIPSHVFMPKGVKSDSRIYASEEEFHYVDSFIKKFMKEQNAPKFNPVELRPVYTMMILQSYYTFINMLGRTYSTSLPVDYVQMNIGIGNEAQKRKKRLLYLETLEDRCDEKEDSLYIDTCNLTRQST